MAYQVVSGPDIGQFLEFESPRVHTQINSWGLSLVHNKLTCGKRELATLKEISTGSGIAAPYLHAIKIEGKNRGEGKGTTHLPVTTACPEAGK